MPLTFAQKLAKTRSFTQTNQLGVDSQEVYNEAILDGILNGGATNTPQSVTTTLYNIAGAVSISDNPYAVSFMFSSDFTGTFGGVTMAANTIINLSAKSTLNAIDFEIVTGSVTVIEILN